MRGGHRGKRPGFAVLRLWQFLVYELLVKQLSLAVLAVLAVSGKHQKNTVFTVWRFWRYGPRALGGFGGLVGGESGPLMYDDLEICTLANRNGGLPRTPQMEAQCLQLEPKRCNTQGVLVEYNM